MSSDNINKSTLQAAVVIAAYGVAGYAQLDAVQAATGEPAHLRTLALRRRYLNPSHAPFDNLRLRRRYPKYHQRRHCPKFFAIYNIDNKKASQL